MSYVLGISERMFAYYEKGDYDGNEKRVAKYLQKLARHEEERNKPGFSGMHITVVKPEESQITRTSSKSIRKNHESAELIPYYDIDFVAGSSIEFIEDGNITPEYYMDIPEFRGCKAFRAYSDSMEPLIKSGNVLFAKKITEWKIHLEYGQIYGVVMSDKRRYLKYIRKFKEDAKGFFQLVSANVQYDEFEVPKNKIHSLSALNFIGLIFNELPQPCLKT